MTARPARWVACGAILVWFASLAAGAASPAEIARAIRDLGDNQFEVREKASTFLRSAGRDAEVALGEAANSTDAEVSRRSGEILEEFKWGIYPDTPKKLLPLIETYRSGDPEAKAESARKLAQEGRPGYAALGKIITAEPDEEQRKAVRSVIDQEVAASAGRFIAKGDHAAVDDLLDLGRLAGQDASARNYAAWQLLRDKLPARIEEFKALAAKEKEPGPATRVLVHLHRAKEDGVAAARAAEKLKDTVLLQGILLESGAWKELAQAITRDGEGMFPQPVERLGFSLAFHRLAGDKVKTAQLVEELKKVSQETGDPENIHLAIKGLFLNDRPADGMAMLRQADDLLPRLFEMLVTQGKYTEAFALVKKAEGRAVNEMTIRHARALYFLTEADEAGKLLDKIRDEVAKGLKDGDGIDDQVERLLRTEMRIGLKEQAAADAVRFCAETPMPPPGQRLLTLLFPDHAEVLPQWLQLLQATDLEDSLKAKHRKLSDLFGGKLPAKELDALFTQAEERAKDLTQPQKSTWLEGMAEAALANKRDEAAQKYLQEAAEGDTSSPRIRLGDLLADKKKWPEAAEQYRLAAEKKPNEPLPLFLQGRALVQAGKKDEGTVLIERAHALPLADESVRFQFASALDQRSLSDDANREYLLIWRVGTPDSFASSEALRHLAYQAMSRRDFGRAADLFERFRVHCLHSQSEFVEPGALLQVPTLVLHNRARALLAAGKFTEARPLMEACQDLMPENVDLTIDYITSLESAGEKVMADELYKRSLVFQEKLCEDHPRSANLHNSIAWLMACCRRDLEKAVTHGKKAVEMMPDKAGYIDTLAEAHFQRGDQAEAVALMKRCQELEPKRDYYKKQGKRFEAGDRKAPVPEANGDE
jgi:tetratricopeptide (TPR) repeat protein